MTTVTLFVGSIAHAQQPARPAPVDPIVADLLATNPSTPTNILRVLQTLLDLRQGPLGKPLVTKLLAMNLNEEQLAVLYEQFGSALFTRLKTTRGLEPEAGQLVEAVMAAVNKQSRDPARISAAVEQLKSDSPAERAQAIATLRLAHGAGAVALWNVLADPSREAEHDAVRRALVALEGDALGPTLAAYDSGDGTVRRQAMQVLASLKDPRAELALYRAAFAAGAASDESSVARGLLGERATNGAAAAAKLTIAAEEQLVPESPLPAGFVQPVTMWTWDATKDEPVAVDVPAEAARLDWAVRWAADAGSIMGEDNVAIRRLFFTALVERSLAQAAAGMPPDQATAGVRQAMNALSIEALEDLLMHTADEGHGSVAVVAAQTLGARGDAEIVSRHAPRVSPLVAATQHFDRRLRFAAVGAVMQLAPSQPYPGSSEVVRSLAFMLRTGGRPRVLVVDARPDVASTLAGLLEGVGYEGVTARDARQAVSQAIDSPDYELFVLGMNVAAPTSGQLIAALRRDARTASVPIAVVVGSREFEKAKMLALGDPLVEAFLRPLEIEPARQMATTMTSRARRLRTDAGQRLEHARQALAWTRQLQAAATPYDLTPLEEPLLSAIYHPALASEAAPALAGFGTHDSQRTLAAVANLETLPLEIRQAASQALVASIRRFGTRLTSGEIVQQYARYNTSEHESNEVQRLLAAILDAIEARPAQAASS